MADGAHSGGQRLDDPARLAALARSELMDSGPEEVFDRLTRLTARLLGTPLAFLTLLDDSRQYFKSRFGLPADAAPLPADRSYCQYVVADGGPVLVEDLRDDPRIADPSGLLDEGLLAYCGVPLTDTEGNTLGTLCAIDESPHRWSTDDVELLRELAAGAIAEIELRMAYRELHAREQEWSAAVGGMHEAFVGCDADGTIVQWNPAAEQMLGYTEAEMLGTSVIELLVPGGPRERARAILAGAVAPTDGRQAETYVRDRRGRTIHVELSLSVIELPRGRRINLICRDVGELRRTQRQQAHLATIVETADEAIGTVDLQGRVTAWNAACERIYGWTAEEVLGRPFPAVDIAGPDVAGPSLAARAMAGESVSAQGAPRRRKDGSIAYLDVSLTPLRDERNQIVGVTAVARDVTEQRRLRAELERSEQRFRRTFDDAPTGITLVATDRTLIRANRGFQETVGYTEEELLGRTLEHLTHPEDQTADCEAARMMASGEADRYDVEKRYIHRSGRSVLVRLSAAPVCDADGIPQYFIVHTQDITAQREAEAATHEAVALLNESQASAHVGSWSVEPETGVRRWSREHFLLHGLAPREQAPTEEELLATVHPDDRDKVMRPLSVLDEHDGVAEYDYRVVLPSGELRTLAARVELLAADPALDRPRRFSGTIWDITVERAAQAAQRAAEQRHGRLLATLPDTMVILYDAETRIELLQGGLVAELGLDPAAYRGRRLAELIATPNQRQLLPPRIDRALAGEASTIDLDLRGEPGSVLDRVFQIEFAPYFGEDGTIVGAFTVWRDITDRIIREEENRILATLVQNSSDAIEAKDRHGTVIAWTGASERLYGFTREEAVGQPIRELILPPECQPEEAHSMARALEGGFSQVDTVRRHKNGELVHVSLSQSPIQDANGQVTGVAVIARDIGDRIRAEEARREISEQLRVTVEHAPIGVALIDLVDGQDGRLLSANAAFSQLLADPDPAAAGVALTSMVHADDVEALRADIALLASDGLARIEVEVRCPHPDGQLSWLLLTGSAVPAVDGGAPRQAVIHALDIGERKRFEGQLRHLADHDPLTGLFNRRRFEQELSRTIAFADRYDTPSALFLIDLDGFKRVNDTMGHSFGDEVLTRVGAALRATLRDTDVIGRLGGDEFAVIVNSVGADEAEVVAEKALAAIREHGVVVSGEHRAGVSASIGVTLIDEQSRVEGEALLARADAAMYLAKQAGRNRVVFTDEHGAQATVTDERSWLMRLRAALEEDRFELFAQPIRGIRAETDHCYELLLRLRGENGELIAPASFLDNAERFDLIQEIDRWVFGQSLQLLRRYAAAGMDVSLSVNMSAKTLGEPTLLDDIRAMLDACPIPRDRLIVEVTETAAIVNIERARDVSRGLRALGIRFALDDFGAGFASFYYLKHLDFDFVKIDGEFIKGLAHNATDQLVIRSVVDLARGLGAQTIAEFVGDEDSVRRLHELGVDYGQGYHLGRPEPIAEILPVSASASATLRA